MMMFRKEPFFDNHHLFRTYCFFHANMIFNVQRTLAKSKLFHINYSNKYDTTLADATVEHMLRGEEYKAALKRAKKELKNARTRNNLHST